MNFGCSGSFSLLPVGRIRYRHTVDDARGCMTGRMGCVAVKNEGIVPLRER